MRTALLSPFLYNSYRSFFIFIHLPKHIDWIHNNNIIMAVYFSLSFNCVQMRLFMTVETCFSPFSFWKTHYKVRIDIILL